MPFIDLELKTTMPVVIFVLQRNYNANYLITKILPSLSNTFPNDKVSSLEKESNTGLKLLNYHIQSFRVCSWI